MYDYNFGDQEVLHILHNSHYPDFFHFFFYSWVWSIKVQNIYVVFITDTEKGWEFLICPSTSPTCVHLLWGESLL
jgi:hypothetical protein